MLKGKVIKRITIVKSPPNVEELFIKSINIHTISIKYGINPKIIKSIFTYFYSFVSLFLIIIPINISINPK